MNLILKSSLPQTKKPGKGKGKPGMKGVKKAAARGSKGKGKKNPRKRSKKGAKKASGNSGDKKEDYKGSDKAKSNTQLCKFLVEQGNELFQPPAGPESCRGCGASLDTIVSSIPHGADWPVSFPLQSAVEFVSASNL